MKLTFDEFRRAIVTTPAGKERVLQMQADIHEAVRASAVTGHPDWDHFVEQIEGRIKQYAAERERQQGVLADPRVVSADVIMAAKIVLVSCNAAIAALEDVVGLPKSLIDRGARSMDTLRAIGTAESPSEASET